MKLLFYDTESTDLSASWGRILCASFLESGGEPYTFRGDQTPYIGSTKIDDSKLVTAVRDELESADIIVGWNSILHDIPLINARLAKAGERPCQVDEKHGIWHVDLMYYSGGASMKVGGRKLDTIARYFNCENHKTPLDGEIWQLAATGDKQAMNSIVEHCEFDCRVLGEVWPYLAPGIKKYQFTLSEVWPMLDKIPSRRGR